MINISTFYPDLNNTSFPENPQTFQTMLNISAVDAPLVRQYKEAVKNSDFVLAQEILQQIPNYSQKLLTAKQLNMVGDTTVALERFWKDDIQGYITGKQQEWQNIINLFRYQNMWQPTTQYEVNNFVMYTLNGVNHLYICTIRPPIGTVPTVVNYWRQLTIRGQKGETGTTMTFMYGWNPATTYAVQNIVTYNGGVWGCVVINTNQPPYEGSPYWTLIYMAGQTIYPFQPNPPSIAQDGELWFQTFI